MNRFSHRLTLVLFLALGMAALPALAGRGDDTDRKSKNGRAEATVGEVEVVIEYGRPQVKGRAIWGGLVPYGKVWRTGADEATTLAVSGPVTLEGESLPAGTYSLFTVPGESSWTVVVNRTAEQWGAYDYDEAQDVLRVEVEPSSHEPVEEMEIVIEGSEILVRWAELEVPVRIEAAP